MEAAELDLAVLDVMLPERMNQLRERAARTAEQRIISAQSGDSQIVFTVQLPL